MPIFEITSCNSFMESEILDTNSSNNKKKKKKKEKAKKWDDPLLLYTLVTEKKTDSQ